MNKENWKILFDELYDKIEPIQGTIYHQIGTSGKYDYPIVDVWIDLTTKGYSYLDPYLGLVDKMEKFYMEIDLRLGNSISIINNSIFDLENKIFNFPHDELIGVHSNQISFSIPQCKFGAISSKQISFEMEYILDTDMGLLTQQSTERHSELKKGHMKVNLTVSDLRVVVKKEKSIHQILGLITKRYDTINYYKDDSINYENMDHEVFMIPIIE